MVSDRWLKVGTVFGVIACVAFAVACGGGGGGGGGGSRVAFLNGSVSYVSGAIGKPISKPGGGTIYKVSFAAGDIVSVPNAVMQLFTIDDDDFSDPIAETVSDSNGNYAFLRGHFLPGHNYADYLNVPLVVRAMFMGNSGQYVAVRQLADMLDSQTADVDPITTAIVQKIVELFNDLGLDLTVEQYNKVRTLVISLLETAEAEAAATGTDLNFDESLFEINDAVYNGGVHTDIDPLLSNAVISNIIDSVMASLEAETADLINDPDKVVEKYINWLTMMGFLVDNGAGGYDEGAGLVYVRVPESINVPGIVDPVDVIRTLTVDNAGIGVTTPAAGTGLAYNIVLVDLDTLFATKNALQPWAEPVAGASAFGMNDLNVINNDLGNMALRFSVRAVWDRVERSKSIISKKVVKQIAFDRRGERITLQEVANAVAALFEWRTEDMMTMYGMVQHFDDRPLDENIDGQGPEVKASTILAELVGTIPASPYEYAVEIASVDTNIFRMAENVLMDIIFQEFDDAWDDGAGDANTFDPEKAIFRHITSFDDVKNIVMGDYAAVPGLDVTLKKSDVFAREVEKIKQILLASLPADWFGKTVNANTEVGFKAAILMIVKVVDQDYLLDKTLGFMRKTTIYIDGAEEDVWEPRWDNFKWMDAKTAIKDPIAPIPGVDSIIKAFFEEFFDGVNPDSTNVTGNPGQFVYDAANASSINLDVFDAVTSYDLWFAGEYHPEIDMMAETDTMGVTAVENYIQTNAHVRFQVLKQDGSPTDPADFTLIDIIRTFDDQDMGDGEMEVGGYVVSNGAGGVAGGLPIAAGGTEYKFQFTIAGRADKPEFFVWLSEYLPDDKPTDGIGEMDMTTWGDAFYLPPVGGYEDFPYVGMIPDDQWWEDGAFVNMGVKLSGYESGMLWTSSDYDMRLETAAVGTVLKFGSAAVKISPVTGQWGLNSIMGLDTSTMFSSGTAVSSITVHPSYFDGSSATDYSGYLIGVTDSSGAKFIVELNWMDWYNNFLDCRFAKVDAGGMIGAPMVSGGGAASSPFLMSGDFLSLETGQWSPPLFCPEAFEQWAIDARAIADIQYNQGFTDTDPEGSDLQKLFPCNTALIKAVVVVANLDTDSDGMVDGGVTTANLDTWLGAGATDISLPALFTADDSVILVKTVNGKYFLLRIIGLYSASGTPASFYPGEVEFEMSWDEDGDGVPEKIPGDPIGGAA